MHVHSLRRRFLVLAAASALACVGLVGSSVLSETCWGRSIHLIPVAVAAESGGGGASGTTSTTADTVFFQRGVELFDKEAYGEAIEEFKKVLVRDKDHEKTHLYMAQAFNKLNRYNEAIASYQNVVRINPLNVNARLELGALYRARVRFEQAIEQYKAVTTLTDDAEPHMALGDLYNFMGQREEAIASYLKFLKLQPQNGRAHYELGSLIYQQYTLPPTGRLPRFQQVESQKLINDALTHFEAAVQFDTKLVDAYIWLASLYSSMGRFADAESTIQSGLKVEDNASLRLKLAEIFFNSNRLDAAVNEVETVLRRTPDNKDAEDLRQRIAARRAQLKTLEEDR